MREMVKIGWVLRVVGLAVIALTLLMVKPAQTTDSVLLLLVRFVFMALAFGAGIAITIISFFRVPGKPPAPRKAERLKRVA